MNGWSWKPVLPKELMDQADAKVMGDIEREGWSGIGVFPTEKDPVGDMPFNYTVGMAGYNHPDLVLMGLDPRVGHGVLCAAVDELKQRPLKENTHSDRVLKGYWVAFVKVDHPLHPPCPMTMTQRFYGFVDALQIVWPDKFGWFPWDGEFDPSMAGRQLVMGMWNGPTTPTMEEEEGGSA